jgi:hypothetical protein
MQRQRSAWVVIGLSICLLAAAVPAQASEVVKLARLVVGGKRGAAEPGRTSPPESKPAGAGSQAHGAGGTDAAGTAPVPPRGVS